MAALNPTKFTAVIRWLGRVPPQATSIRSEPVERITLGWEGVEGELHSGLTRLSCSRMLQQYPRGTEISNVRQLAIVSTEELAQIAERMWLESIAPEWTGASMVLEGIPDLTNVPPSSRLQGPGGVCSRSTCRTAPASCRPARSRPSTRALARASLRRPAGVVA